MMPRKRSAEVKPVTTTGTELKVMRPERTPEVHRTPRVEDARREQSTVALVRGLVEEHLFSLSSPPRPSPLAPRPSKKGGA